MHRYAVGELYNPDRTSWPSDISLYAYRYGAHELVIFMKRPRSAEIVDVRRGSAEFGLVVIGPVILLLYRFGALPWSDAPYSWHLETADSRADPAVEWPVEQRILLTVTLVDSSTGIIAALRAVTWSPEFSAHAMAAIRAQAESPWPGREAYDSALDTIYSRNPDSSSLLPLCISRCRGGA